MPINSVNNETVNHALKVLRNYLRSLEVNNTFKHTTFTSSGGARGGGAGGATAPHRSCLAPPSEDRQRKFMNLWEQNFDACEYGNPIEQYCTNRFTPIKDQIFRRMQYITVWCDTCDHFLKGFDLCSAFNCILSCVHALIHA